MFCLNILEAFFINALISYSFFPVTNEMIVVKMIMKIICMHLHINNSHRKAENYHGFLNEFFKNLHKKIVDLLQFLIPVVYSIFP